MSDFDSIVPKGWKAPVGYSHAITTPPARILVTAGQIGWNPTTGQFETDDFVAQTAQALRNIAAILTAAAATPAHIIRLTWYITDRDAYMKSLKEIGEAYREIMGRHYPAMSVIVVSGLLEPRAKVEIEATAAVNV